MSTPRPANKYPVVMRVDGTIPEWDWFVLGQRDLAAVYALSQYMTVCKHLGYPADYCEALKDRCRSWVSVLSLAEMRLLTDLLDGTGTSAAALSDERTREPAAPSTAVPDPVVGTLARSGNLDAFLYNLGLSLDAVAQAAVAGTKAN